MANICKGISNTGVGECGFDSKALRRIIFVPLFDESGAENKFANIAAVTKTAMQAKFDAVLDFDRFYPLPNGKNVTIEVADDTVQEYDDGSKSFIKAGKENIAFRLPLTNPKLVGALKTFRGQQLGMYAIDADNNMWYQEDAAGTGEVLPIPIDSNSLGVKFIKAVEAEENYVNVNFELDYGALPELFSYIPSSSLDFNGLSNSDVYALRDVEVVYTNISTTGFTANLTTKMGDQVTGLDTNPTTGDLADLYNNDTTSAVVPTGITETPAASGIYVFVYTAQTSGNKLTLTPTRSKYSFTDVIAAEILTP